MTPARRRLAAQAAAAGYTSGALALIAHAALPGYRAGDQLDELLVEHVRSAVEILAHAGIPGDALGAVLARYHRRYGEAWREHFWRRQLRLACLRFNHPELYGRPPCEPGAPARACPCRADAPPDRRALLERRPVMTHLAVAVADAPASAVPPSAAALAARIQLPRRLPVRYDGQQLRHLSNSSYTRFLLCPEDWRRHYLKGERFPATGAMFLGGCVDAALTAHYQRILQSGDTLTLDQVRDAYRELWHQRLAEGLVDWDDDLSEPGAFKLGLDALELTFAELVPRLGTPVAAQRKLEFALAPDVEWTVLCYLDLETERVDETGTPIPTVVDYKVKNSVHTQTRADHDPQAGPYLAGRWLSGEPAREFCFAQIAKPGKRRKQMSASLVTTRRTVGELRGTLARIAQAARQIVALYERLGPDEPWGFADPISWKCAAAYCHHHARCPGGAGL